MPPKKLIPLIALVVGISSSAQNSLIEEGHYNLLLSKRRAQSIQHYLENQGIDPDRFQIAWVGESDLYVDCNNQSCRSADSNRRAEVMFISNDTVSNE